MRVGGRHERIGDGAGRMAASAITAVPAAEAL